MAAAAAPTDAAKAEAFIGSLISLITKSDIRYEGFLCSLNAQESTIGLRNVKSFGTEGRRQDGTQVAQSDNIYEYIYFRGKDIKALQVVSFPAVQSTTAVPDDPAIIQSHSSHTPANITLASPNALGETSNTRFGVQIPPFQGNQTLLQSVDASRSWAPLVPFSPVNINGLAMHSYWPGYSALPGESSHFQQQSFPPPPQGSLFSNPTQMPLPYPSVNASLSGNAWNFAELPRTLLPPVFTSFQNVVSTTVPPPSTAQYSHVPLSTIFSNLFSTAMSNNGPTALPTETVQSGPQMVSSSVTTFDINSVVPSVTNPAQSLLGPAPFPMISKSTSSNVTISSTSHSKASIVPPATSGSVWQARLINPPSSYHLKTENNNANTISSASNLQTLDSKNLSEPAINLLKSPARKLYQSASSSHYGNRREKQDRGDSVNGNLHYPIQSSLGHEQGRGRGNVPYRAASHTCQTYRGRPVGRGSEMIGTAASYPRHFTRGQSGGNVPNSVAPYRHSHTGAPAWGDSEAVIDLTQDFDFEAMNEKFNKEEIWGVLGKKDQHGLEDTKQDEEDSDGKAADEAGDGMPKLEHKLGYCKDDFFDSLSCTALDGESGKEKMDELRKKDAEMPQHGHGGIQGPPRGRGSYREKIVKAVWRRAN